MKILNAILLVIFTATAPLCSQTFVEWTNNGWGYGLGDCRPEIIDIDSDGLLDLFIGNYGGHISHFEQSAPNSSHFYLLKHKVNNIDVGLFASPAFADLDKDGLMDMICGDNEGGLHLFIRDTSTQVGASVSLSETSDGFALYRQQDHLPH